MPLQYYDSPIGTLIIKSENDYITELYLSRQADTAEPQNPDQLTVQAAAQLREYFAGLRTVFTLPLNPAGTPFHKKVWSELLKIPFGTFITYKKLAEAAGYPKAFRAVGGAAGRNPILIIIPCHRVIAANGIGGFSAGIENKILLLKHENIAYK